MPYIAPKLRKFEREIAARKDEEIAKLRGELDASAKTNQSYLSEIQELRKFALGIEELLTPKDMACIDGHERLGHILSSIKHGVLSLRQRAEAAEELVRQASARESSCTYIGLGRVASRDNTGPFVLQGQKLYTSPPVPAYVQWYKSLLDAANKRNDQQYIDYQQAKVRIAELERKVAEQQEQVAKSRAECYEAGKRDAVPEWLPIETAPDKGTILIFSNKHGVREAKFHSKAEDGIIFYDCMVGGGPMTLFYDATHWMPLPAAPKQEN